MEAVDQALLKAGGTSQGKTGEHAAIQPEGNRGYSSQNGNPENAANPLLRTQGTLHGGEDAAAGEQGNGQGGRCSSRVAEEEYGRMGAGALQGCPGKNEA